MVKVLAAFSSLLVRLPFAEAERPQLSGRSGAIDLDREHERQQLSLARSHATVQWLRQLRTKRMFIVMFIVENVRRLYASATECKVAPNATSTSHKVGKTV
jgi:hypothetical protein